MSLCPFLGDAAVLNNVAHTFGLMDTIKKVLDNRKNQTEQGEEQFLYTLAGKVPNKVHILLLLLGMDMTFLPHNPSELWLVFSTGYPKTSIIKYSVQASQSLSVQGLE